MPAFQFLGEGGRGLLESALGTFGSPYHRSEEEATAALFYALVKNHPFQDGNKRFAIVATQVALMFNGRLALLNGREWEELALSVADNSRDRDWCERVFRVTVVDLRSDTKMDELFERLTQGDDAEASRTAFIENREILTRLAGLIEAQHGVQP